MEACPNRLYMILQVDEPDGDVSSSVVAEPVPPDLPSDDSPTLHHLSLQAYLGTSGKCTIYFSGSIYQAHRAGSSFLPS